MTAATVLIRRAAQELSAAGVPSPQTDAELLASHVLGVPRGRLPIVDADPAAAVEFRRLVAARGERVPLQHLTGTAAFRTLDLAVGPGVFVPRPETEVITGEAIAAVAGRPAVVVDLCAGSGAIGLSIAVEAPGTTVIGVEADPGAAEWCGRNAEELKEQIAAVGSTYRLAVAGVADDDWAQSLAGTVDVLVANPPYIPDAAVPREPEVARHDPPMALYGGFDGMSVVHQVIAVADRLLAPGGRVLIEHGEDQAATVTGLLRAAGFEEVITGTDLTGRDRWTSGVHS